MSKEHELNGGSGHMLKPHSCHLNFQHQQGCIETKSPISLSHLLGNTIEDDPASPHHQFGTDLWIKPIGYGRYTVTNSRGDDTDRCSEDGREDSGGQELLCDTSLFGCDGAGSCASVVVLQRQRRKIGGRSVAKSQKDLIFWEGTLCVAESGATGN
eukprot:scaffold219399_cov36-Cyclotella_meneghiniana.AAC.1